MSFSVVLAGILGTLGAWTAFVLTRGTPGYRRLGFLFLAIQVMVATSPMILHAVAWESTAGKFGLTMMTQTGARVVAGSSYGIFAGLLATGWIHGIVGASIVCLATFLGTTRIPTSVIDSGTLRFSPSRTWWSLRLPLARHWWITALLATAMLAATEMTIADLYGLRTLADEFYLLYAASPSSGSIIRTCILPSIFLIGGISWWFVSRRRFLALGRSDSDHMEEGSVPETSQKNLLTAALLALTLMTLSAFAPVFSMILKLGQHTEIISGQIYQGWSLWLLVERLLEAPMLFLDEYYWTAILACFTGSISLIIAWPLASLSRAFPKHRIAIDLSTLAIATIPGPIIAMTLIHLFQLPIFGFAYAYELTIFPTSLALLARAVPISYWVLRIGYSAVPDHMIESSTLQKNWISRLLQSERHLVRASLIQAWLISTLHASGDLPATLPILPPGMTTVGSRLFGLLHSGARFQEAALAFWYLIGVTSIGLTLFVSARRLPR